MVKLIFILICHTTVHAVSSTNKCYRNSTVNGKKVRIERCCTDLYEDGGICKECPNGYFGKNCNTRCFYPLYGRLCRNNCNCTREMCNHVTGCSSIQDRSTKTDLKIAEIVTTEKSTPGMGNKPIKETEMNHDNGRKSPVWIYVVIITSILVVVLIVIVAKYGYGKAFVRQYICKNTEPVADIPLNSEVNSRPPDQRNIDIKFRHLAQSNPEEDVYCEIRESMMIDTLPHSTSFTCHLDQNDVIMTERRFTMRDNVYHHLHFNKSLPNLVEVNEYSHADTGLANLDISNKICRSDHHLCEVRKSKAIDDHSTSSTRESLQENRFSNNYYQIWENNNI